MEDERAGRKTDAMIPVIIVAEGQTEESFISEILAPAFIHRQIYVEPRLIRTSRSGRGGALSRGRVLRYLRNTLRERKDTYVTTLFDLYALDPDFPGCHAASAVADPLVRASTIEIEFTGAVIREAQCRVDRFFPHIQPYEFEALLFTDTDHLVEIEPSWKMVAEPLRAIRAGAPSPEHINDGLETHPSARLSALLRPRFEKVLHGPAAAKRIGLDRIREECQHFNEWLTRIEELQPL